MIRVKIGVVCGKWIDTAALYSHNSVIDGGSRDVAPQHSTGPIKFRNLLVAIQQILGRYTIDCFLLSTAQTVIIIRDRGDSRPAHCRCG